MPGTVMDDCTVFGAIDTSPLEARLCMAELLEQETNPAAFIRPRWASDVLRFVGLPPNPAF